MGVRILLAFLSFLLFLRGAHVAAQQEDKSHEPLCYGFLRDGDVFLACNSRTEQITRFGDVEDFAVAYQKPILALIRHRAKAQGRALDNGHEFISHSALQVIPLNGGPPGRMSPLQTPTVLQPSCGTVLSVMWEPSIGNRLGRAYDVLTGQRVEFDPYKNFRCSSDRKVVVGWENPDHMILKVGTSAERTLYAAAEYELIYDVSPNGEYIVYNTIEHHKGKLCLIRSGEETRCIEKGCGMSLSVSDSGAVLIGTVAVQGCYFKDSNHFSPTPRPGYTDETDGCPAVDYWNPRDKSSSLVEPLGRNPQWITPDAAAALRAWRSHESAVLDY